MSGSHNGSARRRPSPLAVGASELIASGAFGAFLVNTSSRAIFQAQSAAHPASPMPPWIAHRGGGSDAPENTLAAFALGHAAGFRAFECDVQRTRDGVCVLMHDDGVERTTSGRGDLLQHDWAEVASWDAGAWHSPAFCGVRVARLDELLAWARPLDVVLNLELKPLPGDASANAQAAAETLRTCDWAMASDRLLISSFAPQALASFARELPQLPRALLCETLSESVWATAQDLKVQGLSTEYRQWSAEAVARAHSLGWATAAYTVNRAQDIERMQRMGVDSWFTDAVREFGPRACGG